MLFTYLRRLSTSYVLLIVCRRLCCLWVSLSLFRRRLSMILTRILVAL